MRRLASNHERSAAALAALVAIVIAVPACGTESAGPAGPPPTLNIVVRNQTARDLVLQFSGTDAAGAQRLEKSLVAACHVGVAAMALTQRWTLRLDRTTLLASGEQPEVFDDPRSASDVTLRVSVELGAIHMDRLVPGIPGPDDSARLIPGCL